MINLDGVNISFNSKPYIIAEIGVNHEGSVSRAKQLIDLAIKGGADAVKFQTYKAEKLASKNSPAYWDTSKEATQSQYKLFKKYDSFEYEDYLRLSEYSKKLGITFISTAFDLESVDKINNLVAYHKISSSDITNLPLLERIASKKKPVLLSTGASNINEIKYAVDTLKANGAHEIIIMHCILNYPTKNKNANLDMIIDLKKHFPGHIIGYSDHCLPDSDMNVLVTSFMLGAVVIEKHFTDDKSLPGNDHYHSMDYKDLRKFRDKINMISEIKGIIGKKECIESENIARLNARRSLVLKHSLKKNHKIELDDLIAKRPGIGISPLEIDKIIGKTLVRDIKEDHILDYKDFK